jgi:DNA-binding Lrp family transcriptional regulator
MLCWHEGKADSLRIDDTDRKLLALLVENGRASFAALGEQIGLSTAATKRRVDRLRREHVIRGFGAEIDPAAMGWNIEAFVELYCNRQIAPEEMKQLAAGIPEVHDGYTVTGDADGILLVRCSDATHLEEVLGTIREHDEVIRTRSAIVMSRV